MAPSYCAMPIHIPIGNAKDPFSPTTLAKMVMFCLSDDSHSKKSEVVLKIIDSKQSEAVLKITDIKCTHHTHTHTNGNYKKSCMLTS